jgi:hypothetical protein
MTHIAIKIKIHFLHTPPNSFVCLYQFLAAIWLAEIIFRLNFFKKTMKNFKKTMKTLIFIAIMFPMTLHGQSRAWPDSSGPTSAGCYRIAVTPLTEAPPFRSDMSLSTLLGYIYLDSIMRTPLDSTQWANFNLIQSFDSLNQILKYLYAVIDYDPVLLAEYDRDAPYINPGYWNKPAPLVYSVEEKIGSVLSGMGDTSNIMYLTCSSYILHIKIASVTPNWDTMGNFVPGKGTPVSCVEAVILDTIKGQHILTGDCEWDYRVNDGHTGAGLIDSSPPSSCFHFYFNPVWDKSGNNPNVFILPNDSIVFTQNSLGWNAVVPDSEYIVFFNVDYEDYNGINSYFGIRPVMDGVGGIYPVVDGMVSDPKNLWRMGTSVDLDDFESGLEQTIYNIENP